MKIAVTGYKGRLGSELIKFGCIPLDCDITNVNQIKDALDKSYPDVIINCAAITNVDACEDETVYQDRVLDVNFKGVYRLRNSFPGYFIHISTDYVFDCSSGPYSEDAEDFLPLNNYGWSKYGAEASLMTAFNDERTVIVRTTGLYGSSYGKEDFVTKLVTSLRRGEEIKVTNELHGNHTYIPYLALALIKLCSFRNPAKLQEVIHIASKDVLTRYEFALMVAGVFELNKSLIIPCKNKDVIGWIAKRPTKGGLKIKKADKYGIPVWDTLSGLKDFKEKGIL